MNHGKVDAAAIAIEDKQWNVMQPLRQFYNSLLSCCVANSKSIWKSYTNLACLNRANGATDWNRKVCKLPAEA
jgi:hypothetical protein